MIWGHLSFFWSLSLNWFESYTITQLLVWCPPQLMREMGYFLHLRMYVIKALFGYTEVTAQRHTGGWVFTFSLFIFGHWCILPILLIRAPHIWDSVRLLLGRLVGLPGWCWNEWVSSIPPSTTRAMPVRLSCWILFVLLLVFESAHKHFSKEWSIIKKKFNCFPPKIQTR